MEKNCKKDKKRETSSNEKMLRIWQNRAGKLAAAQGENAEISARKALKIRRMPPTEHSKTLQKYKLYGIYYRIY